MLHTLRPSLAASKLISTARSTTRISQSKRALLLPRYRLATMATISAEQPKREWLVMVKDFPGKLDERVKIRDTHLKALQPLLDSKFVTIGGASLAKPLEASQPAEMTGSVMVVTAQTKEEVLEWMRKDIYGSSGVWDVENADIRPFRTAVRVAL